MKIPKKVLNAHSWLEAQTYPNGESVSLLMDDYAKYYHEAMNTKSPTPTDYDHVDLILKGAEGYGLRLEVERSAHQYLATDPTLTLVEAYTYGYNDWVK